MVNWQRYNRTRNNNEMNKKIKQTKEKIYNQEGKEIGLLQ